MPTKNEPLDLSAGTLYIRHPETSDTVLVGDVKSVEVTQESTEYLDDLGRPYPYITPPPGTWSVTLEPGIISLPRLWLMSQEPRLVRQWLDTQAPRRITHLFKYAKKGRARSKNLHRLVRLFLEEART